MLAKVARFTNTKYTNNKITSIKANNQIKMSTDKRDVSQSPVLLESNKSIAEDKMSDLNAYDIDSASTMVAGSAFSMGLKIVGDKNE